ncbi:MAG: 30S ribosomal protein S18 [Candidatus Omnitrophota bacterium]
MFKPFKPKDKKFDKKRPSKKKIFIKKSCRFCTENLPDIDYKDAARLRRFTTEKGKILPSRITGNCAKHQRATAESIKKSRFIALLPYVAE